MRRLLELLVARPVAVSLGVVALVGLGLLSLTRLPVTALPPLARPLVRIEAAVPGLGMEQLENELVAGLEERLLVLTGVDGVTTWCRDGFVAGDVAFRWGAQPERSRLAVTEAVEGLTLRGRPVAWQATLAPVSERPSLVIVVEGETPLEHRSALAEELLLPALVGIPGVARAEVVGGVRRRVVVRPDLHALSRHGATLSDLRELLGVAVRRRQLGQVTIDGERAEVVTVGVSSPSGLAALSLPLRAGASVPLSELAEVGEEPWPEHGSLRVGGQPTVGVALSLAPDANALVVARGLERGLAGLEAGLPEGVRLVRVLDEVSELVRALQAVLVAAALGAAVAGLLLGLFLRRPGPLLVLVSVIPLSLAASLPVFEALGLSLNLVSLVGMALAAGMLVDAGVVVLDATSRAEGDGPRRAVEGTARVARAILASAVTTAVVFVPALYLRQLSAALFRQLGIALMVTLLASLALALLVVPVAAARLRGRPPTREGWLEGSYRRTVGLGLEHGWWALLVVAACVVLAAWTGRGLPQHLLAPDQVSAVELNFATAGDSSGPEALLLAERLEELAAVVRRPGERDLLAVGQPARRGVPLPLGFWRLPEPRTAAELALLRDALMAAGPDLVVQSAGPAGGVLEALPLRRLAVELSGAERETLMEEAERVAHAFGESVLVERPPLVASLEARPTALGLELERDALERALTATLPAVEPFEAGEVRLAEPRLSVAELSGLPLRLDEGPVRPLAALVGLEPVARPAVLARHQGQPALRLVVDAALGDVSLVEEALGRLSRELPEGLTLRPSGGVLDWQEARRELGLAVGLGLVLVLLVLAALYESFRMPFVVLSVLPFAALGGLAFQRLWGQGLDLGAGLGFVLLTGLAVNNGVLLVDRLRGAPASAEGWARRAAERLRPVLVTTLTTVATLAPLALVGGGGSSLRRSLAATVLAGLLLSTPAALFVLPPLARLLLGSRWSRGGTDEEGS